MKYEAIIYQKHGAVARVMTNRPRYKNAQSRLMIEEMDHAFAAANADEDVRVIILAAAGDTFSSGHDIGTREEKEDMRRRPFPKGVRGEYALSRHLFLDTTLAGAISTSRPSQRFRACASLVVGCSLRRWI
jgi:enoyl-CoA hydratase/carnithine racemase